MRRGRGGVRLVCATFVLLAAQTASAQVFSSIETKYMRLLYVDPVQTPLVRHVGRCFQNSIDLQHKLFGYTPSEKITVLLRDVSDVGNASASGIANFLVMDLSPFSMAYETVSANERINWVMNHELVHIATVDQASRSDRRARAFFGGKVIPNAEDPESVGYYYLTTPRDAVPRWLHEGIAVFVETWASGGQGRAQGAYDEMAFRAKVRDNSRFYDPLSVMAEGTKIDFQVEVNLYLYGARFITYLAYRYSPEEVIRWLSRPDDSKAYYTKNFKAVFGITLDQAWREWVAFEKEFQGKNLAAIRKYPTTPYKDIAPKPMGSVSRAFVDEEARKVYVAFDMPGLVAHVGAISLDDGSIDPMVEVKQPVFFSVTSLAFDPAAHTLFYTTDHTALRDLRALDLTTGESKMLLRDARIGELAFDPADKSLWGVRHFNAIATLVHIPYPYTEWKQIRSWPYGEVLYDVDVSKDGTMLSMAIGAIDGQHTENVFKIEDLLAGKAEPIATFDFNTFIPSGFIFSNDGRYLYGSSYYTGVSNIFRYELATKKVEALSNAETGFFRPVPMNDGSLFVFRYSGEGFVPATIEAKPIEDIEPISFLGHEVIEKYPELASWKVGSPLNVPIDDLVTYRGPYHPFKMIGLESWYPIIEGYSGVKRLAPGTVVTPDTPVQHVNAPAVGFRLNFSDPLQINHVTFNASYSPDIDKDLEEAERVHLHLNYKRYDWTVDAKLNAGDFYDLFGPTKVTRKGYSLRVAWDKTLLLDQPRKLTLTVDGAFYGNLEVLPYYQNVGSPADRLVTGFTKLHWENLRASLGSVEAEKGQLSDVYIAANYADGDFVPQLLATYDFGFQLPLRHSSIWFRNAAGVGFGDRNDTFAQFFFGAFGNNWVDHGVSRRYREFYAFPGIDINEVGGRTFGKAIIDWNLPPIYMRRVGTPGFFANWARSSVFVSGLTTDFDGKAVQQTLANVGAQMDIRFTVLSRLPLTLSFGYAAAFQHGEAPRHEGMISLKVLP